MMATIKKGVYIYEKWGYGHGYSNRDRWCGGLTNKQWQSGRIRRGMAWHGMHRCARGQARRFVSCFLNGFPFLSVKDGSDNKVGLFILHMVSGCVRQRQVKL